MKKSMQALISAISSMQIGRYQSPIGPKKAKKDKPPPSNEGPKIERPKQPNVPWWRTDERSDSLPSAL